MAFRAVVLLLTVSATTVYGYSSGAPQDEGICKSMTPKHPGAPQTTASPFGLSVDKTQVKTGDTVTLTISSTGPKFKGYLVQGRKGSCDDDTTPVGTFNEHKDSKLLTCSNIPNSSITHSGNAERDVKSVQWNAPNKPGTYVVCATIVQDGLTYWVRQPSQTITVS